MNRLSKRILSSVLSFSIIFGTYGTCIHQDAQAFGIMPVKAAENNVTLNPATVDKTITDIIKAFSDIIKTDDKNALLNALGKLNGTGALVGGGIAILQMAGVIKDPTSQKLEAIMNQLNIVMNQLEDVNRQIKSVQDTLHTMQSQALIKQRDKDATDAMSRWEINCLDGKLAKLEDEKSRYKILIYNSLNSWTNSSTKNDLTAYLDDQYEQVWNINGETVDGKTIKYTVTLPQSVVETYIPSETLKRDSYTQDLITQLTEAIYDAADRGCDEKKKDSYKDEQEDLDETIKQFKKDFKKGYKDVIESYEKLKDEMEDSENQVKDLTDQKTDLNSQLEAKKEEYEGMNVEVDVDTANKAVEEAQKVVDGYNTTITDYENTPEEDRTDEMKAAYENAKANLEDAENTLNKALEDQTNANKKVQLETEIKELESKIKDIDSQVTDLNKELKTKKTDQEDLKDAYEQAKKIADEQQEIDDGLANLETREHSAPEKLEASKYFYTLWEHSSEEERKEKAGKIATAMVNQLVYDKSCEAMSSDDGRIFINDFRNDYVSACKAVLDSETIGMKNFWVALTNTYAFEGQATQVFNQTMDFLIRSLGLTGSFLISMEEQDDSVSEDMLQSDIDYWTNAVNRLQNFKDTQLTGHKNYCYLTNTVLEYKTFNVTQTINFRSYYRNSGFFHNNQFGYEEMKTDGMTINVNDGKNLKDKNTVSDDILGALSILAQGNPEKYLKDNGVVDQNATFVSEIAYQVGDVTDFNLNDEINSTCHLVGEKYHGRWYTDNKVYKHLCHISDGGWYIHKKVQGSTVDLTNNSINKDKLLATCATQTIHKSIWDYDEAALFSNMDVKTSITSRWHSKTAYSCWQEFKCTSNTYGFIESIKV